MMKKIVAFVLVFVCVLSLCACSSGSKTVITANGETVENVEYGETLFEVDGTWTITKLDENIYYKSSFGTQYHYSMVVTNDEYSCYVNINRRLYTTLSVGDVIDGYVREYLSAAYDAKRGTFSLFGSEYECNLYQNVIKEDAE